MLKFGLGQSALRVEDARLLTGKGRFTDDVQLDGAAYGVTLRSPYGHARIVSIDVSEAKAMPGVLAVYTAADFTDYGVIPCLAPIDPKAATPRHALAADVVRFVGDGVAFVVATTRAVAKAAAEVVQVEYADLPAVATMDEAMAEGAAAIWAHSPNNQLWTWTAGEKSSTDAAFKNAAHITKLRLVQNRVAPTSMEVRAAVGDYNTTTGYTLYTGSQGVANMRGMLAGAILKCPLEQVRVITGDVGGGFGMKSFVYPEYILVLHAAKQLGCPVKWTGDRNDAFQTDTHGRDMVSDAELALDAKGMFLGLRVKTWSNMGGYQAQFGPAIQTFAGGKMVGGLYRIPAMYNEVVGVATNTAPVDAYRGAGRPEAAYITERLVETAAMEMGIGRDVIRRQNLLRPDELPYQSPLGNLFDVGNFPALLDKGLQAADWHGFAARKSQSAKAGKRRGQGICYYVEIAGGGGNQEYADAKFMSDGTLEVAVGTQSNGQGHETAYAQVVAATLGVDMARVRIVQGDTNRLEVGHGTGGSRSLQFGGAASIEACKGVVAKGKALAKAHLESDSIDYEVGLFKATGTNRSIDLFELAKLHPQALDARGHYKTDKPTPTFPNGCHVAEIEIDPDTGVVEVVKYSVVDDFGTIINLMLLQGQIHGGVAQGLGQVLLENVVYGEGAQLLTGSMMDYAMPKASHMPHMMFDSLGVPNPNNPLGVKGCGEAGTIGAMPSIMNAIVDALDGVQIEMPATPEKVWRALHLNALRMAAE